MMFEKVKFGKYNSLSPFLLNVSVLNNLKTSENKRFADVSGGMKKGYIEDMALKVLTNNFFIKFKVWEKLGYIP